jgi:hypothetical protein
MYILSARRLAHAADGGLRVSTCAFHGSRSENVTGVDERSEKPNFLYSSTCACTINPLYTHVKADSCARWIHFRSTEACLRSSRPPRSIVRKVIGTSKRSAYLVLRKLEHRACDAVPLVVRPHHHHLALVIRDFGLHRRSAFDSAPWEK